MDTCCSGDCRAWLAMNATEMAIATATGQRRRTTRGSVHPSVQKTCSGQDGGASKNRMPALLASVRLTSPMAATASPMITSLRRCSAVGPGRRHPVVASFMRRGSHSRPRCPNGLSARR